MLHGKQALHACLQVWMVVPVLDQSDPGGTVRSDDERHLHGWLAPDLHMMCRNPAALIALFGAVGGTGAIVYDYHKALQFVGVFGLLITAIWRYNSMKVCMCLPSLPTLITTPGLCLTNSLQLASPSALV